MPRWTDLTLVLSALMIAAPAAAQDLGVGAPRSASDWLAGKGPARPPASAWRPGDARPSDAEARRPRQAKRTAHRDVATSAAVPRVGVTRLSDGNPDTKGAIPAGAAGLPRDLWGPAPAEELVRALSAPPPRLRTTRALLVRMLTAQLAPPTGSAAGDEGRLFQARVDRLIALGLLPEAQALLQAAGAGGVEGFARRFDVALYEGSPATVCRLMNERPGLSPGLDARVFCLAQTGDWAAAALTLHGASAQELIAPQTAALLERFLDDSSADLTDSLPDPKDVTPLEFRLFEAIGQPLATVDLPVAFAWADLGSDAGWKAQIEAAERLSRAVAIDPARLAAAYLDQKPAASGGVWDRAASYQALDAALTTGDMAAVSGQLVRAEPLFAQAGLLPALARLIAPRLPAAGLDGAAAETAAHLRLLAGVPVIGAARLPEADRALVALAESVAPHAAPTPITPEKTAAPEPAAPAETGTSPPTPAPTAPPYTEPEFPAGSAGASYADAVRAANLPEAPPEGRGLAMLRAIADVDAGLDGDIPRASAGLGRLVELGQRDIARRAAVELLLTDHLGGPRP